MAIFPNEDAHLRLVIAVIAETHDEWQVTDWRHLSEGSMNKLYTPEEPPALPVDTTSAKIAS